MKNTICLTLATLLIVVVVGGTTWVYCNDSETASGNGFQAWSADLWTQTSQADFEAGIPYQTDTASAQTFCEWIESALMAIHCPPNCIWFS